MAKRALVLTEDDQLRALTLIREYSRYPTRDVAMFALSHMSGLRVGEIAELDWEDVLSASGEIKEVVTLTRTKGGRARELYLVSPALRAALSAHYSSSSLSKRSVTRDGTSRHPMFLTKNLTPFTSVTACQLFKRFYADWAKLDGAKGHSGRRTFITNLADRGYNLKHISVLAGHANVQTTAIYVESNPNTLRLMAESVTSPKLFRGVRS